MTEKKKTTGNPMVDEALDALTGLVDVAEAQKDQGKPVAEFTRKARSLVDAFSGNVDLLPGLAGEGALAYATDSIDRLVLLVDALAPSSEEVDRAEGDAKANALRMLVSANMVTDAEVRSSIESLVGRWDASKGKRASASGGSGSSSARGPLGFTVTLKCEHAGCAWTNSTGADNLNSLRRQAQIHEKDTHTNPEFVQGNARYVGLTDALASVGMYAKGRDIGSAKTAQGGGYLVTRSA